MKLRPNLSPCRNLWLCKLRGSRWVDKISMQCVVLSGGCRFSVAWWAYTYPMSAAAITAIQYSQEVTTHLTQALAISLSAISSITVLGLFLRHVPACICVANSLPKRHGHSHHGHETPWKAAREEELKRRVTRFR